MNSSGCERPDLNRSSSAYEADDLTACPRRNGPSGRIRTYDFLRMKEAL